MIVLVFGLPGTGKSYFSNYFAREIGAIHLNTDMVREKLNAKGHYDEKTKQQVYDELFKQVKIELDKGVDVIVDGTFHKSKRRGQIMKLAVETNEKIYFIEIKASEETVKKRLKKNREYSEADFGVYEKIKKKLEPYEENHLELWSDTDDVEELINKAKKFIHG